VTGPGRERDRQATAAAHILAGQSIVLLAETSARFLVEPAPSGL
jgi:hypothetical protein